jgi:hypothetical protein
MWAGRALRLLESALDTDAYASVLRLPAADAGCGEGRPARSALEWTVLVSAPAYEQLHRGESLADVVEQALSAYQQRAPVVHGVDDLEFAVDPVINGTQAPCGRRAFARGMNVARSVTRAPRRHILHGNSGELRSLFAGPETA